MIFCLKHKVVSIQVGIILKLILSMHSLETIVSRAKRKGFVYPGSDIYGWLANAWDYGPYWVQLKKNIQDLRWKTFVQTRPDMVGLDAQILMHPKVWETSWHVDNFDDPLIDDKVTGERFRADKIIEETIESKWFQLKDLDKYWVTNLIPESRTFEQMHEFIVNEIPNNPNSKKEKTADRTEVRKFQMMFYTYQGAIHDADDAKVWLRPETAQWIFVNFRNVLDTTRMRVPFWIAQVGKAFRNEITPRNFLYRTREFEQMEIEYFVEDDTEKAMEAFNAWKDHSKDRWENKLEFSLDRIKFREHESDELSHYSDATFDVEYQYPWWWWELQWIAYRTDFDLRNHQEASGKNMQYSDPHTGKRYIPHVIEPSFWLSRMTLAVLLESYHEEALEWDGKDSTRVVVKFPFVIAPVKVAIFPLIKKDENHVRLSKEIYADLSQHFSVEYDDGWAIWKRYRRQDEIGTPYCITVDNNSIENGTVTVRNRDTMEQETIDISELLTYILSNK